MIFSSEQKIAYGNTPLPSKTFQVTRVKDEQKFLYQERTLGNRSSRCWDESWAVPPGTLCLSRRWRNGERWRTEKVKGWAHKTVCATVSLQVFSSKLCLTWSNAAALWNGCSRLGVGDTNATATCSSILSCRLFAAVTLLLRHLALCPYTGYSDFSCRSKSSFSRGSRIHPAVPVPWAASLPASSATASSLGRNSPSFELLNMHHPEEVHTLKYWQLSIALLVHFYVENTTTWKVLTAFLLHLKIFLPIWNMGSMEEVQLQPEIQTSF